MKEVRKRVQGFTVDGTTSRDLDDAIWVEVFGNVLKVQVHIADPTEEIELNSDIEKEARSRLFTRYLAQGNIPMLPRYISEDKCSLWPDVERPTLTVETRIDQTGFMLDYSIYESTLVSLKKFSYDEVETILQEKKAIDLYLPIKLAELVKDILSAKRQELGAIGAVQRKGYFTDEEGRIISDYSRSQSIIAEFAILANTIVAKWAKERSLPIVYRNHQAIAKDTEALRVHMNNFILSKEERFKYYHQLGKAQYSTTNKGHFALALPGYLHFTSPLRRFADFLNHRMIKAYLRGKSVPYPVSKLEKIANRINSLQNKANENKSEKFKERFFKQASVATDYNSFNDKELFRIIQTGDFNEQLLIETYQERIKNNNLKEKCTIAGLFLIKSKTIQTAVAQAIPDSDVLRILNLATSLLEKLHLEFIELENSETLKKTQANLNFNGIEIKAIGTGINKKTAKSEAAKSCLLKWIENENF